MKIAIVYNRESRSVINLFGRPNREKIGMKTIRRLEEALKKGDHQVIALEGDKDLIDRLGAFMPRVLKGERPGMVFNVSYGIQGQARYTHVPSILEMVGIPYVASGPLAHSLALDKVVTKMILRQHNLPTPDFIVLDSPEAEIPKLTYPMIVKPKNEAVSFGLKVVHNEKELREAAGVIFKEFEQAVLAEQFIEGREVNVGLLGNNPPEAFPPVELKFGKGGPGIYTYEDKTGRSGREIGHECPAKIGPELTARAVEISKKAFMALGCYDCARVDMRLDKKGNLYILEINSLPSLGEHGSYLVGAAAVGLDFTKFVNRLVEVASSRYFGTPQPPQFDTKEVDTATHAFSFLTERRERMEKRLREWTSLSSRTGDAIGMQRAVSLASEMFDELGMKPVVEFTNEREVWTWETAKKMDDGTLFIGHLDVPLEGSAPHQPFRRDPEWLYGEGIGSSRAPLVMLEFALRSLRSIRRLRSLPLGVLLYGDEGSDARASKAFIEAAAARAKQVLILRPGNLGDHMIVQRRGHRKYRFRVEGDALRPGRLIKKLPPIRWTWKRLEELAELTSHKNRISVSTLDMRTERLPMRLPHRITSTILVTYPDPDVIGPLEERMRAIPGKSGPRWELELLSDRPPMRERKGNQRLAKSLAEVAKNWEIPLKYESSTYPSVAGLVPVKTLCLCGAGPVARDLGNPGESIQRISLVQRTLLLAEFLAQQLQPKQDGKLPPPPKQDTKRAGK
ncbi:MAG: ATP-grasp domain-containing protein [Bryobacterales bacterium]